jgi:peptidoglycan-associated lipoprotein
MKKIGWLIVILCVELALVSCAKKAVEQQAVVEAPQPVQETSEVLAPEPTPPPAPPEDNQSINDLQAQRAKMAELERFLNEYVYFDFDKAVLRTDAVDLLQVKAQWLKDNPSIDAFIIEGHCDARGTDAYNMALGERRAEAVKQYMVDSGLPQEMFKIYSFGEERPLDFRQNEEAWAKNRRAAFVISH